jgi:hypothetical protein
MKMMTPATAMTMACLQYKNNAWVQICVQILQATNHQTLEQNKAGKIG